MLPHRYPFLLVDKVLELVPREKIVALKNVTVNEEHLQGHFPGRPVMPGVLLVEALAQAGALLLLSDVADKESKLLMITGVDKARFRRQVVPGDQVILEMVPVRVRSRSAKLKGVARVDGETVAEAVISSIMVDR
jgi:beta-hydroxyacyl-ACP dehydratase FabZ